MITVSVSHNELIDWLETLKGGVYENVKEDDRVEQIQIGYADIFITIGTEEEGRA